MLFVPMARQGDEEARAVAGIPHLQRNIPRSSHLASADGLGQQPSASFNSLRALGLRRATILPRHCGGARDQACSLPCHADIGEYAPQLLRMREIEGSYVGRRMPSLRRGGSATSA